ncbi:MAG: septal ring lytic transglycosylase RlpA family protein [Xanthobacteraceae bacterium]
MSSIGGETTSYFAKAVPLFVVALTAMTLPASAQSRVVASAATGHPAAPGRTFVTNKKPTSGSRDALYGLASFYTEGSKTASGEKIDGQRLTTAHRTLPFGPQVRVTNVANGRSVTVRINDRGPFVPGRVVDVSYLAAETLWMTGTGVAKVKLEVVP